VAAGHKVAVYDADPRALRRATESGASAAHSPADVKGSDITDIVQAVEQWTGVEVKSPK
jgi:3-hydroxyisobutyrate dehydrogenase-like beta-hydroxyacid dehydrogenase